MGNHGVAVVQLDDEKLSAASDRKDLPALKTLLDLGRRGIVPGRASMSNPGLDDASPPHRLVEMATGDFDFRELGQQCLQRRGSYRNPAHALTPPNLLRSHL